jgi:copper chaperone CopZ
LSEERRISRVTLNVSGMDCVTCSAAIEKRVKKVDSIVRVGSAAS